MPDCRAKVGIGEIAEHSGWHKRMLEEWRDERTWRRGRYDTCSYLLSFWNEWMILHDPELRRVVRLVADSSPRSVN
jgi:hypothetical protein